MGGISRHIRRTLGCVVAVLAIVGQAAPVPAAEAVRGFTWFHDGEDRKTGPSGTVVSAFATGATPNSSFKLRIAPAGQEEFCSDIGATDLNANVRYSSTRGLIATTAGVANRSAGEYEICFYQIPLSPTGLEVATFPIFLTLV